MDTEETAWTIGRRIRQVRKIRGKPLRVIAGLAGMSKSHLDRIERGERSPTLRQIVALAEALQTAPSELTRLPIPGGLALPVAVLREQVDRVHAHRRACRFTALTDELPGLIRNLHTALTTGTDHGELLDLAVSLHVHVTRQWLAYAGAPTDLLRRTVFLARRLARERDEASTLAVADVLLSGVVRD